MGSTLVDLLMSTSKICEWPCAHSRQTDPPCTPTSTFAAHATPSSQALSMVFAASRFHDLIKC
eukprot:1149763-Pelagomonas_calceolata.AAC.9